MMLHPPLLRSVLYVPANNEKALAKIVSLSMDAVIFDLEDAVAPETKEGARENLRRLFKTRPATNAKLVIRINALTYDWGEEDLLAARACRPDAILLPKVETPQDILSVTDALNETDAPDSLKLWAMIETPRGLMNLSAIAELGLRTGPRLECLVAGSNDLALETGAKTRSAMQAWLSQIVLGARAGGLAVLDGVFNDFRDTAGLAKECELARDSGFDGKTLIHPDQISEANRAFAPSELEIAAAQKIVEAFTLPENQSKNVISIHGKMVESLHMTMAQNILAKATAIKEKQA